MAGAACWPARAPTPTSAAPARATTTGRWGRDASGERLVPEDRSALRMALEGTEDEPPTR